jgi:hypothetical protein
VAWIPGVVALIGLACVGGGFFEANALSQDLTHELTANGFVTPRAQSDASTGKVMQAVGWAGVGLAAAGLAVAGVLFFKESSAAITPVVLAGPSGGVFAVAVRWP